MRKRLRFCKRLAVLCAFFVLFMAPGTGWGQVNIIPIRTDVAGFPSWTDDNVAGTTYVQLLVADASTTTPALNLDNYTAETLDFKARTYGGANAVENTITISISTNNGVDWTVYGTVLPSSSTMTAQTQIDLSSYSGTQIKIKFSVAGTSNSIGVGIDDINIKGLLAAGTPVITLAPTSLSDFTYVEGNGPSTAQTFTVSGTDLTNDISISGSSSYEISKTIGSGYTTSISFTPAEVTLVPSVYVRLKSGLAIGTYNGEIITATSTGATSKTVTCSGEVTSPPPPDAPVATAATAVGATGFTANWGASSGATGYELDVYTRTGSSTTILTENFNGFTEGTPDGGAGTNDVSSSLDTYTQTGSWSGSKIYQAGGTVKMGASSALGYITTPEIDLSSNSGNFTISFEAMAWNGDATELKIYLNDNLVNTLTGLNNSSYTLSSFSLNLTGGTSASKIKFEGKQASKGRFFLENLVVSQGVETITPISGAPFTTSEINKIISGLDGGTTYYYVVRATNAYGTSANSNEIEVTTLTASSPEPSNHATLFSATTNSSSQVTVTWTDAIGGQLPSAYLVKAAIAPAMPTAPEDFTVESDALLIKNIAYGTQQAVFTGLDAATAYNFAIWPYTNSGTTIDYKTDGSVPQVEVSTSNASSTYAGSGVWNNVNNWNNGLPSETTDVIVTGNVTIDDAAIAACRNITIAPGGAVTVGTGNSLSVAGNFLIQSHSSGTGSFIGDENDYNIAGTSTVQLYLTGAAEAWHLLSSPVENQAVSGDFTPSGTYGDGTGYDLYAWDEPTETWLNQKTGSNNITSFVPAKGYLAAYQSVDLTKSFTGTLNEGIYLPAVSASGTGNYKRANLLGNPYPSSIDWKSVTGLDKSDLEGYENGGVSFYVWNEAASNYGVYNDASAGDAGTNGTSRYIAPMQGFFVIAAQAGEFGMDNDARAHNAQAWLKSGSENEFRLTVTAPSNAGSDEVLLDFGHADAQGGAEKWFSMAASAPALYVPSAEKDYSIRFLSSVSDYPAIPLAFKAGLNGEYTLSAGFHPAAYSSVMLTDHLTGKVHDLKANPVYAFTAATGDDPGRFLLSFGSLGIEGPQAEDQIQIYACAGTLYLNTTSLAPAMVKVYNLTGQLVMEAQTAGHALTALPAQGLSQGIYVVNVVAGDRVMSRKVAIRP